MRTPTEDAELIALSNLLHDYGERCQWCVLYATKAESHRWSGRPSFYCDDCFKEKESDPNWRTEGAKWEDLRDAKVHRRHNKLLRGE